MLLSGVLSLVLSSPGLLETPPSGELYHHEQKEPFRYRPPMPTDLTALRARARSELLRSQQARPRRSEEHTSELQSHSDLVCRLLLEKKKKKKKNINKQKKQVVKRKQNY